MALHRRREHMDHLALAQQTRGLTAFRSSGSTGSIRRLEVAVPAPWLPPGPLELRTDREPDVHSSVRPLIAMRCLGANTDRK